MEEAGRLSYFVIMFEDFLSSTSFDVPFFSMILALPRLLELKSTDNRGGKTSNLTWEGFADKLSYGRKLLLLLKLLKYKSMVCVPSVLKLFEPLGSVVFSCRACKIPK